MKNPNYGRPSARKLALRMQGWGLYARSFATLRKIHAEISDKKSSLIARHELLENCDKLMEF